MTEQEWVDRREERKGGRVFVWATVRGRRIDDLLEQGVPTSARIEEMIGPFDEPSVFAGDPGARFRLFWVEYPVEAALGAVAATGRRVPSDRMDRDGRN